MTKGAPTPAAYVRGGGIAAAGKIFSAILHIATVPYLLDAIGTVQFGLWSLILGVVGLASAFEFGVQSHTLVCIGRGDDIRSEIRRAHGAYGLIGFWLAAAVLTIGLVLYAAGALPSEPIDLLSAAITGVAWWLTQRILALYAGVREVRSESTTLGQLAIALNGILTPFVILIAAVATGSLFAMAGSCAILTASIASGLGISFRIPLHADFRTGRRLLGSEGFIRDARISNIADLVNLQADRFLVAAFGGAHSVAIYELAFRIANGLRLLSTAPLPPLFSYFARNRSTDDGTQVRQIWWLHAGLTWSLGVSLLVSTPYLTDMWVGNSIPSTTVVTLLMQYLILGAMIHLTTAIPEQYLRAKGSMLPAKTLSVSCAVVNMVLSLALGPTFGVEGIVGATTISLVAGTAIFFFKLRHEFRGRRRILTVPSVVLLAGSLIGAGLFMWRLGPESPTVTVLLAGGALGSLTAAGTLLIDRYRSATEPIPIT